MTGSHKIVFSILLVFTLIIMSSSLSFADGQSVSSMNGNLALGGGTVDSDSSWALSGSLSIPIPNDAGIQLDSLDSEKDNDDISGFGFQIFRRNPEYGLFGVKLYSIESDSIDVRLAGIQGELYKGMFTLSGEAGMESGDIDSDIYARLDTRYYLSENLSIELGVGHLYKETYGRATIEWQTDMFNKLPGLTFFVDASGENDTEQFFAGIKYYFGKPKSLIRRHREDDRPNTLIDSIWGISSYKKRL